MGSNPVGGCSFCNNDVTIKSLFCNIKELNVTSKKLLVGESNPGRLRDRQKCYQLHQPGKEQDTTGFEPVTAGSAILCSTTELSIRLQFVINFFAY